MKSITIIVTGALLALNLISFFLMGHDKKRARQGKWRAILFGALGGTLGMYVFRHKTKHWYFKVFFPLLVFLQAGILGYLWGRGIL